MGRPRKIKADIPTTDTTEIHSGEFGQKEAEKIAASYLPKNVDELPNEYKKMWVTSDKCVFLAYNHGAARTHADKQGLELFKIENNE